MNITNVPPVVLVSILPFGVTEKINKGVKKRYFRFSLSLDLKSVYEQDTQPEYAKLKRFISSYGISSGNSLSLFQQIWSNINVEIYQTGAPLPKPGEEFVVSGTPAFNEFENAASVKKYWEHFKMDTLDSVLQQQQQQQGGGDTVAEFRRNQMASVGIGTFYNPKRDSSDSIYKIAVDSFLQIQNTSSAKSFVDTLKAEAEGLQNDIEAFNKALQGINNYSESTIQQQSSLLFAISANNQHLNIADSIESIFSTFSFIHSNIILQRLFGVTIDFEIEANDTIVQRMTNPFSVRIGKNSFDAILKSTGCICMYLHTPMKMFNHLGKQVIVIDEHPAVKPLQQEYFARNYDLGAKLKSLSSLNEKVKDFFIKLQNLENTGPESSRRELMNEWIKLDSAAFTRGMNVYNKNSAESIEKERAAGNALSNNDTIYLKDIVKGYRAGIVNEQNEVRSIGLRKVNLRQVKLPVEFETQDFAFHVDTASHALLEEKNEQGTIVTKEKLLVDTAVLNWAGENIGVPSIFSNTEDETNFETTLDEGSISDARKVVTESFSNFFTEKYKLRGVEYKREKQPLANSLSKYTIDDTDETKPIQITYQGINNQKLIFGNTYRMILTPEYKNGWAVPFNATSTMPGLLDVKNQFGVLCHLQEVPDFVFKKNESVRHVNFFLGHRLLDQDNQAVSGREGESLLHLVIRNYSKKQDHEKDTDQISVRYILPPPIAFEHAFWYNMIFEMSFDESYQWYQKYHFPDNTVDGSIKMKDFYSDGCQINYLPDPLSSGFRFEFYLDDKYTIKAKNYEKYEEQEYYFSGNYPNINAWKLVLEDIDYDEPLVEYKNERIFLRLEKGQELFIEVRTILSDNYEQTFETFDNYNDFTKYGGNELLTPVLKFSVTHAVQRPLIKPKFDNTLLSLKENQGTTILRMENMMNLEQTNVYADKSGLTRYVPNTLPTGNIELYAKWEDYADDPRHTAIQRVNNTLTNKGFQ